MCGLRDESQHAISSGLLQALVGAAISQSTQMGCEQIRGKHGLDVRHTSRPAM